MGLDGTSSGLIVLDAEHQALISSTNEQQYNLNRMARLAGGLRGVASSGWSLCQERGERPAHSHPCAELHGRRAEQIYLDLDPSCTLRPTPPIRNHPRRLLHGSADTMVVVDNFKLLRYP